MVDKTSTKTFTHPL